MSIKCTPVVKSAITNNEAAYNMDAFMSAVKVL